MLPTLCRTCGESLALSVARAIGSRYFGVGVGVGGGVFVVGIGSLAVGVLLMVVWSFFPRSKPFFRGETLNETSEMLVPESTVPAKRSVDGGRA